MSHFFKIHPHNPQPRFIKQIGELLLQNQLIIYPTETSYSIACRMDDKRSLERLINIRQLSSKHHFTLVCHNLSQLGSYARVDNQAFRLIKSLTPGPFTFILNASAEVPKRLQVPKKKTIGIRVPDSAIANALLQEINEPLLSSTLILPNDSETLTDPDDIRQRLPQVDIIIDGGYGHQHQTTVIDMSQGTATITRQGLGQVDL